MEIGGGKSLQREATQQSRTAPYSRFIYAIQSQETLVQYKRHFKQFLRYLDIITDDNLEEGCNLLYSKITQDKEWFLDSLISYTVEQKRRVIQGDISSSTLANFHKPIKL